MPTLEELRIQQAMQQAQAENALAAAEAEQAKADAAQQAVQQVSPTNTPAPETTVTVETPAADNTPAPSATPTSSDQLKTAQDNYNQVNADALKQTQEINAANAKMWSDLINEQYERKRQQEQEMKAQEKANTLSSMATGTTELAAGIINLLSVGQLHASNQQYKSYSQDWMRKAEQDLKEHRARRDNLQATLDRLKLQQQQVATAGRVEEMKLKQQAAKDQLSIAMQNAQDAERRADKEREFEFRERTQERQDKRADASIAQGWAQINQHKKEWAAKQRAMGLDPDGKVNEEYMREALSSGLVKRDADHVKGKDTYYLDYNGQKIPYYMSANERKKFLEDAYAVLKDFQAFRNEYGDAEDLGNTEKNGIIMKYAADQPGLVSEILLYSSPEYRSSQKMTEEVNAFFNPESEQKADESAKSSVDTNAVLKQYFGNNPVRW